jgi:pimeloyl-ACP methyl ester carboxylesterase/tetratricopeptide (TPR) repeat protein
MQETNITTIRKNGADKAVVFLHGFSGTRDDTWDRFPGLLGTAEEDWDIFTIGYATTLLPDVVGIWSADPDLPVLGEMLSTQLALPPFSGYRSLTLVAHSMGGLVVQKALVDDQALAARVQHLVLFGTPSGGLRKAAWAPFWKRQLLNMAEGSVFITQLRQDWKRLFGPASPFDLLVVAGASDQFVPPASSLGPFDKKVQRVVPGDHVSIVKPANADAPSLGLLVATLGAGGPPAQDAVSKLRLAAESKSSKASEIVKTVEDNSVDMSVKNVVDAALALERAGERQQAIALLERYKEKDSDIKGSLGGRLKRMWMESEKKEHGARALSLYLEALAAAKTPAQIYYLAINVAFMKFVFVGDRQAAREMAALALDHANPPGNELWKTATVAEAYLYLNRTDDALAEYRRLLTLEADRWKHRASSLQASRIAAALGDRALAEELESIFTPGSRRVNQIFVSYSHKDGEWLDRLKVMLTPYLRMAETELVLWDDKQLRAGQDWNAEIKAALAKAGVLVALVSSDFLASTFIMEDELPVMVKAAKEGGAQLLWVYLSSAGWEETLLRDFQATHDTKIPLDARPRPEQNEILKSVAQQVKQAALGSTGRFKSLPA